MPDKKAVRTQTKTKTNTNFVTRLVDGTRNFIRETIGELKKVTWPTRQEATNLTRIVLIVIGLMALYFFVIDSAVAFIFELLLGVS